MNCELVVNAFQCLDPGQVTWLGLLAWLVVLSVLGCVFACIYINMNW